MKNVNKNKALNKAFQVPKTTFKYLLIAAQRARHINLEGLTSLVDKQTRNTRQSAANGEYGNVSLLANKLRKPLPGDSNETKSNN